MQVNLSIPTFSLLKLLVAFFSILRNYTLRPNIKLRFEHRYIKFSFAEKEEIVEIPYISFCNQTKKDISINAKKIWINDESYSYLLQGDNVFLSYFNSKSSDFPECDDGLIYKFYRDNWFYIQQSVACFSVPPKGKKIFPLKLIGAGISLLHRSKKKSILLFSRKKVSFTIQIDGKLYEYGLPHAILHSTYLRYLASHTARYDRKSCL